MTIWNLPKMILPRFACLMAVAASLSLSACAAAPVRQAQTAENVQWPPYPNPARITWVKEIRDHQDYGVTKGFWKRLAEMITGSSDVWFGRPYGIYAARDRLFVVDSGASVVHLMDLMDNSYTIIGEGTERTFRTPIAVTGDDDDHVYISDSEAGQVFRYDIRDKLLSVFTPALDRPTGIAYSRLNRLLYVTDTTSHQVVAFDSEGRERLRIGGWGDAPGQFNYPTDLAVDAAGQIYVTDPLNARIQVFSAEGHFLSQFGQPGDVAGTFSKPKGIALDSEGHVYVCDAMFDTIQIFDQSGRVLLAFGQNGTGPGQFWMPSGLFIDADDRIYVSDSYNRRVQVFRYLKGETTAAQGATGPDTGGAK